ncbi:MAG: MATE family efflux transporter [Candidatus Eremiobacteraeota bacterium]|nr:MATE family efflux transporter [Candidatus Eremiobacteraeota bacterium]
MNASQANLTHLPLRRALLQLCIPLTGAMTLETAFNFVNGYWVGKLGTAALAAVNLCSFTIWMLFAQTGMISTGANSVIAQRIGAGQEEEARRVGWLAVVAGAALGTSLCLLIQAFADPYLAWQASHNPAVQPVLKAGTLYLRQVFWFAPIFCLNECMSGILRAYGDTRTPLHLYAMGFGVNFALDPLLILGWGSWPGLGLRGAAYASGFSFLCVSIFFVILLQRRLGNFRPAWSWLGEILRIGLPTAMTAAFFCLIYMLIAPLVGGYGPSALAALGLGHRIESFSYLVSHGLGVASITLVGQHMGAGDRRKAYQAGEQAVYLVSVLMGISSLALFFFARPMVLFFSADPEVLERAVTYLRFMSLCQWSTGVSVVLEGVMSGAGRPLLAGLAASGCAAVRLPMARFGASLYQLHGIWAAMVASRSLEGLLYLIIFARSSVWRPDPEESRTPTDGNFKTGPSGPNSDSPADQRAGGGR